VDSASDDCVVVDVKMPSEELVMKAVSLQLPPTFFNYLDLPECPGCIGCRPLSELQNVEVPSTDTGVYGYLVINSTVSLLAISVAAVLYCNE